MLQEAGFIHPPHFKAVEDQKGLSLEDSAADSECFAETYCFSALNTIQLQKVPVSDQ